MNPDNVDERVMQAPRYLKPASASAKIYVDRDNQVLELTSGDYTIGPPAAVGQRLLVFTSGASSPTITFPAAFQANGNNRFTLSTARTSVELYGVEISGVLTWQYKSNTATPSTFI